jgi:HK97 family phage portal protein
MSGELIKVVPSAGSRVTRLSTPTQAGQYVVEYGVPVGNTPGIQTGEPQDWFGPLNPIGPSAPPEVAGRQFDFPSGYNLNIFPRAYEPIQFPDLRNLADSYDVLRTIIETRKDQMAKLEWTIRPRMDAKGQKLQNVDPALIEDIRQFFAMPNREDFWDAWLRQLLEDLFVIDAPTVYVERDRAGRMMSLEPIDGATIKRVIDDYGRTPIPPVPAYQQVLKGLPAVNYTSDDILYKPRNVRTHKVYGYSPVEQIVMTVNIALRREIFLLNFYTEGNMPEALAGVPATWTRQQITDFQRTFDSMMQNDDARRRRLTFVPGDIAKNFHSTKEGALTDQTDEWLTRICCFAFSIAPTPFIKQINRATAGTSQQQAAEEGLAPIQKWVKQFIDFLIVKEWNTRDVEFDFALREDVDPQIQETILTNYVKGGVLSVNEARQEIGKDPTPGGDTPKALTQNGWVPLDPVAQAAQNNLLLGNGNGTGQPDGTSTGDPRGQGVVVPGGGMPDVDPPKGSAEKPTGIMQPQAVGDSSISVKPASSPINSVSRRGQAIKLAKADTGEMIDILPTRHMFTKTRAELHHHIHKKFKDMEQPVLAAIGEHISARSPVAKDISDPFGPEWAMLIANNLDLSSMHTLASSVSGILTPLAWEAAQTVTNAAKTTNDAVSSMFSRIGNAVKARAMEMVGLTTNAAGDAVQHASPTWSIVDSTRNIIARALSLGIKAGASNEDVLAMVAADAFSGNRAALIADTEAKLADGIGAAEAAITTGAQKWWVTMQDGKVETECLENEEASPIDAAAEFPSGHMANPAHPNCRCHIRIGLPAMAKMLKAEKVFAN